RQCGAVRPSPGGARRRADEAEQRRARCQSRSGAGKTTIILTAARVNAYRKGGRQRGPVAVRCTGDMAGQLHISSLGEATSSTHAPARKSRETPAGGTGLAGLRRDLTGLNASSTA